MTPKHVAAIQDYMLYVSDVHPLVLRMNTVAYPGILFGGGGRTNSVEDREKGDLGAVAP